MICTILPISVTEYKYQMFVDHGLKDFFTKKRLPSQASELASGNLEGYCKPMSSRGGVTGKLGN